MNSANEALVLLEAGKAFMRSGELEKALEAFSKAEALDPRNAHVHFEKGNVHLRKNDPETALREYERALEIDPGNDQALVEAGKLCSRKGQPERAISLFSRAAAANPDNPGAHLELGKALRLRGNGPASRKELELALTLDPGNDALSAWMEKTQNSAQVKRETPPYRVFFTWGMHYACNYKCSYCYTPRPEEDGFAETPKRIAIYPGTPKIVSAWEKVAERYGNCRIRLDGGEPSLYPDFIALVNRLSELHSLQINTNLSFDVPGFLKAVRPDQVRIDASFHSEYMSIDDFAGRVKALKENGFKVVTAFVAYPPFIDQIAGYKDTIEALGAPFIIHPYSGGYNGKSYPADYTPEETRKIYRGDESSETELEWRKKDAGGKETGAPECERDCPEQAAHGGDAHNAVSKTRACRMGQMYARIYPDGSVYRCCTDDGLMRLGSLFEGFSLLDEATPCSSDKCRCWRCMVPGEEDRWLRTWLDDWEMPF